MNLQLEKIDRQIGQTLQNIEFELNERLKIKEIAEVASHKTVPIHQQSIWYYFGGISLFFFAVQMFTGILLLFQYEAGIGTAHASMLKLINKVEFGRVIRSAHSWSANLMVLSVMIHMFSAYFMKAYQKPREFTWISGTILLFLTVTLGFTGYLLPWDDLAYFATKVGLEIAQTTPWVQAEWSKTFFWPGQLAADILRGGGDITNITIQRFFGLHVVVLPWIFTGFLGFHLFLVQLHGNKIPKYIEETKNYRSIAFFPNFFYKDMFAWLVCLNLLAILAVVWPWHLGPEADPLAAAIEGIHPEWYFMAPFELLKWTPAAVGPINGKFIGIALFGGVSVLLFLVPLWDPHTNTGRFARIGTYYGIFSLFGLLLFTFFAYWCLDNNSMCNAMHGFFPSLVHTLGIGH